MADCGTMANETNCPTCSAEIPLSGDEKSGEEIFCTVCGVPALLRGDADGDECAAEEDL
jgi:hypothetical protein